MKTFNITLRDFTFPVITEDENLNQGSLELGLDCLFPSRIPAGIEPMLSTFFTHIRTDEGVTPCTRWILIFSITNRNWPNSDPNFAEDFASTIKNHILENEEGLPSIKTIIDNDFRTLTVSILID